MMNNSISVIIPSRDGYRDGNVPKLLDDIKKQTIKPDEVRIIRGESPCSRAHNVGVRVARGELIVFFDDDVRLGDEHVIEHLIRPLREDRSIGITGASQQIPPDSSPFQKKYAIQIKRATSEVVHKITDSDMATHAAMAIRKDVFWEVGGENENLIRGDDPEFRYRIRKAGYRIVVIPHTWVYHPPPATLPLAMKSFFFNGMGAAHDYLLNPDLIVEVPDGHVKDFVPKRSLGYRIVRGILSSTKSVVEGKEILLLLTWSYYLGYLCETSYSFLSAFKRIDN